MSESIHPALSGVVVHWQDESRLERLVAKWPEDPRYELLVVDNGSARPLEIDRGRVLEPERNLGFAGGVNLGLRHARAPIVLLLNPDVCPRPRALDNLLLGFERHPDSAGLAPRLVGSEGEAQFAWQLQSLPSAATLLRHALLLPARLGAIEEPRAGQPIEQPAAAALAVKRMVLVALEGLDEQFFPAWFEDVDLAKRLQAQGQVLRYWPAAEFTHQLGATVARLGYPRFLWIYFSNLCRYLHKHHGPLLAGLARLLLVPSALLRLLLLPARKPRRARSRRQACGGLVALMVGAISGWKLPPEYRRRYAPRTTGHHDAS